MSPRAWENRAGLKLQGNCVISPLRGRGEQHLISIRWTIRRMTSRGFEIVRYADDWRAC